MCGYLDSPRGKALSGKTREISPKEKKPLSLSFSLSSLSRYRSYRDCFRERLAKEDRDAVHRREYSYHDAPPRSFSFRKRIHVVDRSIAQDATDRFYQTKRTLVSPIQRGDPFLSVGWVSLFFRSPPFIDVPSTLSWKGSWRVAIATSSFSLSSRDSLSFRLSSSLDSLCPASGLASGSVYINVWGQS